MKATIGLDAGHGGSSSGTYTVNSVKDGLFEKDFTLDLVKRINEKLLLNGFKTVLTRTSDYNPGDVSERAKHILSARCDFAISVHFNGFGNESANGTECFVPHGEEFAQIEVRFQNVLQKFFKLRNPFARSNNKNNRNDIFDKKMNKRTYLFDAISDRKDYFGFIRTCWEGGLSADLLEICFLTNPKDFSTYVENVDKIADGLARAIVEGFGEKYISEPKIIKKAKNRIDMVN
jgi:N-acetylmuramoyl-L-alanine amidase